MKKLYVGNLPYTTTDDVLKGHFVGLGTVLSAKVITDRDSGRSKGFGFVEMENDEEADKAIAEMNGKDMDGRNLVVNEARPMQPRDNNRGGGGSGGGYGSRNF
ncbi:MAG TPA: RNA-binding protein [Candidatus Paceibacterota bacterium]